MQLPFFYEKDITAAQKTFVLSEETSKHCVQVLRMKEGENLRLTNGMGDLMTVALFKAHKREAVVEVMSQEHVARPARQLRIAISPLKNASRFEWFLEKAAELGINTIVPLQCARTEKTHFRWDRMNNILIAAMLQSQQAWLCELRELTAVEKYISECTAKERFIAHCFEGVAEKKALSDYLPVNDAALFIGPEGDFTTVEVATAVEAGYKEVTLGTTRLRTETAGVAGAVMLVMGTAHSQ